MYILFWQMIMGTQPKVTSFVTAPCDVIKMEN